MDSHLSNNLGMVQNITFFLGSKNSVVWHNTKRQCSREQVLWKRSISLFWFSNICLSKTHSRSLQQHRNKTIALSNLEAMKLGVWILTTEGASCSPCVDDTQHITEKQPKPLLPGKQFPEGKETIWWLILDKGQCCETQSPSWHSWGGQFCVLPAGDARP